MRLVGAVVALMLATSSSYADRPPFEVVQVLGQTNQVLIYDRANNTHVLLTAGAQLDGYTIAELSGVGIIVEKDAVRTAMYPRGAHDIVLNLEPVNNKVQSEIIGKTAPAPTLPVATTAPTAPTATTTAAVTPSPKANKVAVELASLLTYTATPPRNARLQR